MNFLKKFMVLFTALLVVGGLSSKAYSCRAASKILYNGKIFTSDVNNFWVDAVAIRKGLIVKTGTVEEVMMFQNPNTVLIDLQGKTAIPGLNEAHMHLIPYIANGIYINDPMTFIPGPGPSLEEIVGTIKYLDSVVPQDLWFYSIVGENFVENKAATRELIDLSSGRPVIISGWSGHYLLLNSAAMQVAGISETEPDPYAGSYDRYEGIDKITGVCRDYAIYDYARRVRNLIPDAEVKGQLEYLLSILPQLGITSIQDIPIGFTSARYKAILDSINSPVRVRNIAFPYTIEESKNMTGYSGIKWILDGTEQESGMFLSEPYYDNPSNYGNFTIPLNDFDEILQNNSWRLRKEQKIFHANGDQTIDLLLNAMNHASPWDILWRIRRVRIEHGILIRPDHIPDIVSKGIVVIKNPTQFITGETLYQRLGPVRFSQSQLLKTLIDNGVNVALASDQLGGPSNPFMTLKLAVVHPKNPSEAITMEQAVIAHTRGSSYAEFTENIKGRIKPGQLADIIVLSQDIFNLANLPTLENTTSVLTIIGGNIVFNAGL